MSREKDFVSTSVSQALLARMTRTHEKRRISVFAGPPGIGKSTTIERFRHLNPSQVAVFQLEQGRKAGHGSIAALQFVVSAVAGVVPRSSFQGRIPRNPIELRNLLFDLTCEWAHLRRSNWSADLDLTDVPRVTVVIDEAQYLSDDGIEALRAVNDAGSGGMTPFPMGLILIGNNTFALKAGNGRDSVIGAAVRDRLLYSEEFNYADVKDDDIALFLESKAEFEPKALRLTLDYFKRPGGDRSFRSVTKFVELLVEIAGSGQISADTVSHAAVLA